MTSDTAIRTDPPHRPAAPPPRRRRSRARRIGLWSLGLVVLTTIAAGLLVFWLIGNVLHAPDWLRERISVRIEQALGGSRVEFGDVDLVIGKGWRPRVRLRDVVLADPDGQPIVRLADADASLALRPLLRGELQPKRIALTGISARLHRDRQGRVALSLGEDAAPVERAAGLPQLIEEWDQLLLAPQLSALVAVEMTALTLRYEDAGQRRAWTLDGGRARLDRTGDDLRISGNFALLSGRDYASSIEANYASRIGDPAAEFGILVRDMPAQDIAAQGVALAWLDVLRAPISGALRGSVDAAGALGPLSATLQIGPGVLQPTEQTRPIPFSGARSYFTYAPDDRVLNFDELSVSSAWGTGSAEGRAYLGAVADGRLSELIGQFTLTGLSLNPAGLYRAPPELRDAEADFRLELDPFRLTLGQMSIAGPDGRIALGGTFAAEPEGWRLALDGRIDALSPERLVALWPEGAAPKPRAWVAANLSGGTLSGIDLALRARPGDKPDIYADFDYEGSTIRFLKTMPPITGAAGQASLNGGRFVVTATAGQVMADEGGALDVAGTSFIIPDVTIRRAAPGLVRMVATGSVTAALSLLDRPPIRALRDTPLPADLAGGQVRLAGTLSLPLKMKVPYEEIVFHVAGELSDVTSTVLVPGQTVTAPRLRLEGDQTQVTLSGEGRVGPVPVDLRWRQPLGKGAGKASRVEGRVELSPRLIETFAIGLPPGSVSGQGSGTFTLDLGPGAPPVLNLRSDLRGVGMQLPALGWAKPRTAGGLLEISGTLGAAARIDRLVVRAAGLSVAGSVQNRAGGGLDRARLESVRLDDWLDVRADLIGRGGAAPELRVLGGRLDLRRATFGGGGGGGGPMQVALEQLQISDTIALTGFAGRFDTAGGFDGDFRGRVNGQTEVIGQVVPRAGRSAVRIRSDDAGGVFRAAGVLRQGRGGSFDLSLLPAGAPGQFDGTLRVTDTRVEDAPAIAALLNAVSIVGLLDELSGQGIQFAEVDARFRLGPSTLTLYESSATGPSIGLSMDGTYDLASTRLNMRGVISPVYLLNSIGSLLTRKGEGMFGFNYTLRGPAQAPAVQVNPLSALTPAMFRDLLRGPRPQPEGAPPRRTQPRFDDPAGGR